MTGQAHEDAAVAASDGVLRWRSAERVGDNISGPEMKDVLAVTSSSVAGASLAGQVE